MHPLTRQTLAEARRRGHSIDLDKHIDAIIRLEQAARDTQAVGIQDEVDWLDRPIVVGDVTLLPLSFAGKLMIEEFHDAGWFVDDPEIDALAITYVLAHSRNQQAMMDLGTTERQAARTIRRWAISRNASLAALLQATRRIMHPARTIAYSAAVPVTKAASTKQDTGYVHVLLARLVHEFGQTRDYWLFAPWADVEAAINVLRKYDEAMSKALGKGEAKDPDDPSVQAFVRWRKAQAAFLASLEEVSKHE